MGKRMKVGDEIESKGGKQQQVKPWECDECPSRALTKDALNLHKKRKHPKWAYYEQLERENERLKNENAQLKEEIKRYIPKVEMEMEVKDIQLETIKAEYIKKLGKKKAAQAIVKAKTKTMNVPNLEEAKYAAYRFDFNDEDDMKQFISDIGPDGVQGLITDAPWSGTGCINGEFQEETDKVNTGLPIERIVKCGYWWQYVTKNKIAQGLLNFKKHGFKYIDTMVWIKSDTLDDIEGVAGHYFDHQFEIILVGRTEEKYPNYDQMHILPDVIVAPRRYLNQKPDELRSIIEEFIPGGKFVELHARDCCLKNGWISAGNQISKNLVRKLVDHNLV